MVDSPASPVLCIHILRACVHTLSCTHRVCVRSRCVSVYTRSDSSYVYVLYCTHTPLPPSPAIHIYKVTHMEQVRSTRSKIGTLYNIIDVLTLYAQTSKKRRPLGNIFLFLTYIYPMKPLVIYMLRGNCDALHTVHTEIPVL